MQCSDGSQIGVRSASSTHCTSPRLPHCTWVYLTAPVPGCASLHLYLGVPHCTCTWVYLTAPVPGCTSLHLKWMYFTVPGLGVPHCACTWVYLTAPELGVCTYMQ